MSFQLLRFGKMVATSTGAPRHVPKAATVAGVAFGR